jgi:hypothetical protein
MAGERILHCWADGPTDPLDGCGSTCMLRAGHVGGHLWYRDDEVSVEVTPVGQVVLAELEEEVPRAT